MIGTVVALALLGGLVGLSAYVFVKAPNRGIWNKRPKHPFKLPVASQFTETMGQGETRMQEYLDVPPVSRRNRKRRR